MKLTSAFCLLASTQAEVFFQESFADGWEDRWVKSEWKDAAEIGAWETTQGKFYGKEGDMALKTTQDARFYGLSAKMGATVDNKGKDLVLQYSVKNEQDIDCGGAYIKLLPDTDQKKFGGDSEYALMFGPDICGYTKKTHDWNDEDDGEWEAPQIDNPEFKGEWTQKEIDNPAYKGEWEHPQIANPDYAADDNLHNFCKKGCNTVGFELWQVKAGTLFDDIIVTDSVEEAKKFADETFYAKRDAEKKMAEKQEADEKAAKDAEDAKKKEEEDAKKDDDKKDDDKKEDDDDDEDKEEEKKEL